jgi:divalent metal cation (Fe/Co/Zn/Cd) transporter
MDEHRYDDFIELIRKNAMVVDGIITTEKCWVRKSGMRYWVDLHIHVNGQLSVHEGHTIAHNLKEHLMNQFPEIEDVLVHVEPAEMV